MSKQYYGKRLPRKDNDYTTIYNERKAIIGQGSPQGKRKDSNYCQSNQKRPASLVASNQTIKFGQKQQYERILLKIFDGQSKVLPYIQKIKDESIKMQLKQILIAIKDSQIMMKQAAIYKQHKLIFDIIDGQLVNEQYLDIQLINSIQDTKLKLLLQKILKIISQIKLKYTNQNLKTENQENQFKQDIISKGFIINLQNTIAEDKLPLGKSEINLQNRICLEIDNIINKKIGKYKRKLFENNPKLNECFDKLEQYITNLSKSMKITGNKYFKETERQQQKINNIKNPQKLDIVKQKKTEILILKTQQIIAENQKLLKEISMLKASIKKEKQDIKRLQNWLKQQQQTKNKLSQNIKRLAKENSKFETQVRKHKLQIANKQKKMLKNQQQSKNKLQILSQQYQDKRKHIQKKYQQQKIKNQQLCKQKRQIINQSNLYQHNLELKNITIVKYNIQISNFQKNQQALNQKIIQLQQQINKKQNKIINLQQNIKDLQQQNLKSFKQSNIEIKQIKQSNIQQSQLKKKYQSLSQNYKGLQKQNKQLKQEIYHLNKQTGILEKDQKIYQIIQGLQQRLSLITEENKGLICQNNLLRDSLQKKQINNIQLDQKLSSSNIKDKQKDTAIAQQISQYKNKINQLAQKLKFTEFRKQQDSKYFENQLKKKIQDIQQKEQLIKEIKSKEAPLKNFIYIINKQKRQLNNKLSKANQEIQFMYKQLGQLNVANTELTQIYQNLLEEHKILQASNFHANLLFQHIILQDNLEMKIFLKESIQRQTGQKIIHSRLVYTMDPYNRINIHHYIDKKQNLIMIIRLTNGYRFAAFTGSSFDYEKPSNKTGLIIALTEQQVFTLKKQNQKAIIYDQSYIIFGNSQIRVKFSQPKVFSNFGIKDGYYNSRGHSVSTLMGSCLGKRRQNIQFKIQTYEFYQLQFN